VEFIWSDRAQGSVEQIGIHSFQCVIVKESLEKAEAVTGDRDWRGDLIGSTLSRRILLGA
jgi:hypothetical protein